ncbi:MAG: CoA-binding protein [Lewinellaceae bacterium]|nr:CoA-binding protein [Lewinellaceae bacterium]
MKKVLDKFFYPKSVALVGATEKPEKIGYTVLRNLLENGYGGTVYPVNPKYRKLQGKNVRPPAQFAEGARPGAFCAACRPGPAANGGLPGNRRPMCGCYCFRIQRSRGRRRAVVPRPEI